MFLMFTHKLSNFATKELKDINLENLMPFYENYFKEYYLTI